MVTATYRPLYHVTTAGVVRAAGDRMSFIASDESPDRLGDVIMASGWKLENFRRNPVLLWAHDARQPAIGRVVDVHVEGKRLLASVEWANTPFAQEVAGLYGDGFMSAVSVGFRPLKSEPQRGGAGTVFLEQELLELSAVAVGAHPDALKKALRSAPSATGHSTDTKAILGILSDIKVHMDKLGGPKKELPTLSDIRQSRPLPSNLRHWCPLANRPVLLLRQRSWGTYSCPCCGTTWRDNGQSSPTVRVT